MEKSLIIGQRYTFYLRDDKKTEKTRDIRANLKRIYYHSYTHCNIENCTNTVQTAAIIVNNIETEIHKQCELSFPLDWLHKAENLDSILGSSVVLPSDILLHIDNFA